MTKLLINKNGYRLDFSWLKNLEKILDKKIKKQISFGLVSSREMKNLNHRYRHKNKDTDVLSFRINTKDCLGEVIISVPKAKSQAKEMGHNLVRELKILTIHGILHILGYDHEKSDREARRQAKAEKQILSKLEDYGNN